MNSRLAVPVHPAVQGVDAVVRPTIEANFSGMALANAKLGAVHGLAGVIGASRMRRPVASKNALAIAAMGGTQAISPAPLAP